MPLPPFAASSGPRNAKIAIVGEAWGEEEEKIKRPFIGQSGQELTRLLSRVGIFRKDCFFTNVFALRPQDNKIEALCGGKKETGSKLPMLAQNKYLFPQYQEEVLRLKKELDEVSPNIVIALGGTACWALLDSASISSYRGTLHTSSLCPNLKVLPTYHPSAILRNWSFRPIVIADLIKAEAESKFPQIIIPDRKLMINPIIEEVQTILPTYETCPLLSVDIETGAGQIKTISFSPNPYESFIVPFVDLSLPFGSYWSYEEEILAWAAVRKLLASPVPKLFQNGLYDLQYLVRWGIKVNNCAEDTMLLHHALYPEMQKGLGFLGSIYTNSPSWKDMRKKAEGFKKDE